jgi:small subunit ribosomal protein S17
MQKTVVVEISRRKLHPLYRKQYRRSTRIKAHDEAQAYRVGDRVVVEETRPLSRTKRWRVVRKV